MSSQDDKAKLYVGHLAPHTTKEMLLALFQPHGSVLQVDVIPDRERHLAGAVQVECSLP
jgi:hypothetical protein